MPDRLPPELIQATAETVAVWRLIQQKIRATSGPGVRIDNHTVAQLTQTAIEHSRMIEFESAADVVECAVTNAEGPPTTDRAKHIIDSTDEGTDG